MRPNMTELLEEAKRRYPIGTRYKPVGSGYKGDNTVHEAVRLPKLTGYGIDTGIGYIWYENDGWAEIVSSTQDNYLIFN